jgi:hypothetical protein
MTKSILRAANRITAPRSVVQPVALLFLPTELSGSFSFYVNIINIQIRRSVDS